MHIQKPEDKNLNGHHPHITLWDMFYVSEPMFRATKRSVSRVFEEIPKAMGLCHGEEI